MFESLKARLPLYFEAFQVLVWASILTVIGYVLYTVATNVMTTREIDEYNNVYKVYIFEITPETSRIVSSAMWIGMIGLCAISLFTNAYAIACSGRNDKLTLPIRLITTSESVNRLLVSLFQLIQFVCPFFEDLCPDGGVIGFIQSYGNFMAYFNYYCQMEISFSRFMSVSFNGLFFQYTLKWPLAQLLICYVLGLVNVLVMVFAFSTLDINFITIISTGNTVLWTMIVSLTISLDFFTARKLKKWHKHKASTAEKRLMKQMICNSIIYFINYFLITLFTIIQNYLMGPSLNGVFLQLLTNLQTALNTLGLSIASFVLLKKKSGVTPESSVSASISPFSRLKENPNRRNSRMSPNLAR